MSCTIYLSHIPLLNNITNELPLGTGDVLYPSVCRVVQPPLPEVRLDATPIPSQCADDNEIGMKFVLEFQGTPPFNLGYSIHKQEGRRKVEVQQRFQKIDQSRYVFSYLPTTSG